MDYSMVFTISHTDIPYDNIRNIIVGSGTVLMDILTMNIMGNGPY